MPLVSVVIPSAGETKTLFRALQSLQIQRFRDFEVIVVDDHAERSILETFFSNYEIKNEVKVLRADRKNQAGRIGELLNLGISHAKGKFIARLDDDDFCLPNRLKVQVRTLSSGFDLVGMQAINIDEKLNYLSVTTLPSKYPEICKFSCTRNPFVHSSVMFTLESFMEIGKYSEELILGQDYDLWLRYINHNYRIRNLKRPGILHTRSDRQLTNQFSKEFRDVNIWAIQQSNSESRHFSSRAKVVELPAERFFKIKSFSWIFKLLTEFKLYQFFVDFLILLIYNQIASPIKVTNLRFRKKF